MSDLLELEVDDEERPCEAVVEGKIGVVAVVADDAAHLTSVEREPLAHLQHEVLDVVEDAVFKFALGILVWRSEEFRDDGVFERFARDFDVGRWAVHQGANLCLVL